MNLLQLDERTPIQRMDNRNKSLKEMETDRRMSYSTLFSCSLLVTATAAVVANPALIMGGITVGKLVTALGFVPTMVKLPTLLSGALYGSQFVGIKKCVAAPSRLRIDDWKVPVGVGKWGKVVYHDFNSIPHCKVSGGTGWGKTAFMRYLLYALCKTHDPDELAVYIIDLKGGCSFADFARLPHVHRIIRDVETAASYLQNIVTTMDERLDIIFQARARLKRHKRFQKILVLIDEGSRLAPANAASKAEREIREKCMSMLGQLAAVGREPQITVMHGTQRPDKETLPVSIRGQMDATFAFHQDPLDSKISLGNDDASAAELPPVRGRMIYKSPQGKHELQAYYVPDKTFTDWIESYPELDIDAKMARFGDDMENISRDYMDKVDSSSLDDIPEVGYPPSDKQETQAKPSSSLDAQHSSDW